jgi:hypothetical protein
VTTNNALVLAYVTIPTAWTAGVSTITAGMISDQRVMAASNINRLATSVATAGIVNTGTLTSSGQITASGGVLVATSNQVTLGQQSSNTVAPLVFVPATQTYGSGPTAGSVEHDTRTLIVSATSTGRQVVAANAYYALGSAYTLPATVINTAYSLFGLTNGLAIQAGTLYEFEIVSQQTLGSGTSKTITLGLGLSGTSFETMSFTVGSIAATAATYFSTTASIFAATAITTTTQNFRAVGQFRSNSSGFFNPTLSYSVLPVSVSVAAGSYVKLSPVRSATDGTTALSVGAWS